MSALRALYIVTRNGQERIEVREIRETGMFGLWSPRRSGWVTPEMVPDSCYASNAYPNGGDYVTEDIAYKALERWADVVSVVKKSRSGPSGRSLTDAEREAKGRVRLQTWLSPEAGAALEKLVAAGGTRTSVTEAALIAAARRLR